MNDRSRHLGFARRRRPMSSSDVVRSLVEETATGSNGSISVARLASGGRPLRPPAVVQKFKDRSEVEVVVNDQRRMVAEALLKVDRLPAGQRGNPCGGQVVVDATKNLQISSHPEQSLACTPRRRSIHDRQQTAINLSPTFMPRCAAPGHVRSFERSENRQGHDRFQSTAAVGRQPLEREPSPKRSPSAWWP